MTLLATRGQEGGRAGAVQHWCGYWIWEGNLPVLQTK